MPTMHVSLLGKLVLRVLNLNLLPEQKVLAIKKSKSKHKNIVMVGDGINDAPALGAGDGWHSNGS